ncbi:MAG: SsrA-binding protein SmpB [Patescibacteria group bacterium]|nr:SsrA-binding protein SmpB [Patescibacteria group bacterium]
MKTLALNRKARHEFSFEKIYEVGLALLGSEVKSIREGRINLADSFVLPRGRDFYLNGSYIAPYSKSSQKLDPYRERAVLVTSKEREEILRLLAQHHYSLVPLKVYDKHGWIKISLGLGKKIKKKEKKQKLREEAVERDAQKEIKNMGL